MASVYDIHSIQRVAAVPRKKPFGNDSQVADAIFSPKVNVSIYRFHIPRHSYNYVKA